ncbi:MAG TPA: hypothetical protein VNM16_00760 [Bacillota bacterium]|nr:hypothetical protein [Bacillota bacterium]
MARGWIRLGGAEAGTAQVATLYASAAVDVQGETFSPELFTRNVAAGPHKVPCTARQPTGRTAPGVLNPSVVAIATHAGLQF